MSQKHFWELAAQRFVLAVTLAVTPALAACSRSESGGPSELAAPVAREADTASLGRIVPVNLVDQDGRPFGMPELQGHSWLVALMFSSCPMACPVVAQRMAYL